MTARLKALQEERAAVRTKLEELDRLLEAMHIVLDAEEGNSIPGTEWRIDPKIKIVNKVKDLLRNAATEGLYPREIRLGLAQQGLNSSSQVVSNALCRLKRRDVTVEANGRHFLKDYLPYIKELQTANPA